MGGEKEKDHPLPTPRTLGVGPWGWPLQWLHRDPGGRWHTYRPDDTEILIGPLLRA